jgi:hypothetical protein
MMSLLLPYATTGLALIAGWCLIGATPRGQPRTPALMLPHGCEGLRVRRMTALWTFRRLFMVVQCPANDCATRGSIEPLSFPQLLTTVEGTLRDTVGVVDSASSLVESAMSASVTSRKPVGCCRRVVTPLRYRHSRPSV